LMPTSNIAPLAGGFLDDKESPGGMSAGIMPGGPLVAGAEAYLFGHSLYNDRDLYEVGKGGEVIRDERARYLQDALSPGFVAYGRRAIDSLRGATNARGVTQGPISAGLGLVGVKAQEFNAREAFDQMEARQKIDETKAQKEYNTKRHEAQANPGDESRKRAAEKAKDVVRQMRTNHAEERKQARPALGIDHNVQPKPTPSILDLGPGVNPLVPSPEPTRTPKPMPTLDPQARRLLEKNKGATL
jgi:hypothetical protein